MLDASLMLPLDLYGRSVAFLAVNVAINELSSPNSLSCALSSALLLILLKTTFSHYGYGH